MDEKLLQECKETVEECKKVLQENTEWKKRYSNYAKDILANQKRMKEARKMFRVPNALKVYSCVSKAKNNSKKIEYDLRFNGQSVATINITGDNVFLSTKDKDDKNQKYFTLDSGESPNKLDNKEWNSKEASQFRSFFKNHQNELADRVKSPEHKIESNLLNGFKHSIKNITPIEIAEASFQMPTVFKGSLNDNFDYANSSGGGIDILARIEHNNTNADNRIAVMELKDENKKTEPQAKVIKQALKYATFIALLLKEENNKEWWEIFRKNEKKTLDIDVVTIMPESETEDIFNNGEEIIIPVDTDVYLHLYSLFFKPNSDNIIFSGLLADVLNES